MATMNLYKTGEIVIETTLPIESVNKDKHITKYYKDVIGDIRKTETGTIIKLKPEATSTKSMKKYTIMQWMLFHVLNLETNGGI
jgi:predicted RNA-binding protein